MFTLEDIEEIFEYLANMETKAWKLYGDDVEMLANETNPDRYKAIEKMRDIESTEIGALQFCEGLIMRTMKRKNFWAGSRAEKLNAELRELKEKQWAKQHTNN